MSDHDLDTLARRRAGAKMGWYIHATVFVAVNLLLATIAFSTGRNWALFPALGWGFGLAMHGLVVFGIGSGFHQQLVERERQKLVAVRDPW